MVVKLGWKNLIKMLRKSPFFKLLNKRNKRVVEYRGSKSKHTLTFDDKYHAGYCCTCAYFVKQAVCSHIVGYDLLNQLGIFNLRIHKPDNNFVVLNKKTLSYKERLIALFTIFVKRASIKLSRDETVPAKDGGVIKLDITLSGYIVNGSSIKAM